MKKIGIKFMFSKKATKIDEIFTVDLKQRQIDGEDFVIFFGRLRKINFLKMNLTGRNTKQLNFFLTTLKIDPFLFPMRASQKSVCKQIEAISSGFKKTSGLSNSTTF